MNEIGFDKIVGYREEKEELRKIANLIKKKDDLIKVGGKLPKGILLIGPNGVGKTELAKAFISEAECQTVNINYNDLDSDSEFFTYIKKKFSEASKKAPCILFIDELDKLIGNDKHFFNRESFDKNRILLNEINKYNHVDNLFIFIIANKDFKIDCSIVRSGRIDRIIEVNLPTQKERKEIIAYYAKRKPFDPEIDIEKLSQIIKGFSGADIESLLNNALIKSFTEDNKLITSDHLMSAYYDKIFKNNTKELDFDESSLRQVAFHEAGHAVIALKKNSQSFNCVNILKRGETKGLSSIYEDESVIKTLQDKIDEIVITFGGLVSEEYFFANRMDGSKSDIRHIRDIANELIRVDAYKGFNKTNIFNTVVEGFRPEISNSPYRMKKIESSEDKLINKCYKEAKLLIRKNSKLVVKIAEELIIRKTLNRDDCLALESV